MAINARKTVETDTNPMITGVTADFARLQEIITCSKKVENGNCTYHIIKFGVTFCTFFRTQKTPKKGKNGY